MSERHEITVRGVVVGHRLAGEGSLRISLYTDALGLTYAFAKSAREERSKLRAHLTEGTYGTFTLVRGAHAWRMTGATATRNVYFAIVALSSREAVARIIGTVRQFVRGEGSDPYFFSVLWGFLHAVPHIGESAVSAVEAVTALRMFAALGYVRAGADLEPFLESPQDPAMFAKAASVQRAIVRAVNEGIAASGL
jgi:recombinational DNA repair protein (RecF pathway)